MKSLKIVPMNIPRTMQIIYSNVLEPSACFFNSLNSSLSIIFKSGLISIQGYNSTLLFLFSSSSKGIPFLK